MKSQDIFLLLKLISLSRQEKSIPSFLKGTWEDWKNEPETTDDYQDNSTFKSEHALEESFATQYSMRGLAAATGISKSEVSLSLQRCYEAGLAKQDRLTGLPRANADALSEFIIHGLRYVFPVKLAEMSRGIATAWAAPVLQGLIASAGEIAPIWPDARGNTKGLVITPLFKTVPFAVKQDPQLYALLALTDSIRIGLARERTIASKKLEELLKEI